MIIMTLALLASLGTTASAQASTDSDFASALGDIQAASTARIVQMRAIPTRPKPQAPAAPAGPAAPDAVWAKIVEAVKKDGKFAPGGMLAPSRFTLEEKTGDPKANHGAQAITFLGGINENEQFEAMGAVIVVMTYTLDPKTGTFAVEQWLFETDVYGQVVDVSHGTGSLGADGKPGGGTRDAILLTDPKVKAQFDAQLKYWSERSVK